MKLTIKNIVDLPAIEILYLQWRECNILSKSNKNQIRILNQISQDPSTNIEVLERLKLKGIAMEPIKSINLQSYGKGGLHNFTFKISFQQ